MSERRQRLTRPLSRETAQLMLQMKDVLRQHGITISLSAPNVYDLLLQAAEGIDDEEISLLYEKLMDDSQLAPQLQVKAPIVDEESPFLDDEMVNPFVALKPDSRIVRKAHAQESSAEEESGVFLEDEKDKTPVAKRVALHTPRTGLLRCDRCQRTNTVMATASREEPIELQCACGTVYQVSLDSRRFDRKLVNFPGSYTDQHDKSKTGTFIIENISFGGLRFRITSQISNVTYNDLLDIQFTLDDKVQTLIREKVRVHYVHHESVGAEFIDLNELNRQLASYLMR
jgi:hypothetical protein